MFIAPELPAGTVDIASEGVSAAGSASKRCRFAGEEAASFAAFFLLFRLCRAFANGESDTSELFAFLGFSAFRRCPLGGGDAFRFSMGLLGGGDSDSNEPMDE